MSTSIYKGFHDSMQLALRDFAVARDTNSYGYGLKIDSDDDFFTGGAAKKSYLMYIGGERPSGSAATGDSNDALLKMAFTNRALNDANFVMRGINLDLSNRGAGTLATLEGAKFTCKQRGDAGAITNLRSVQASVQLDVGSGLVGTSIHGVHVDMKLEANCPTDAMGVLVENRTDGVYTLPTAAFAVQNRGTSGCKGFEYGLDLYDATADTCNSAEIRMNNQVCVMTNAGAPSDGTSGTGAGISGPGSICVDYSGKKLYVNGNTTASPTWKQVTSA